MFWIPSSLISWSSSFTLLRISLKQHRVPISVQLSFQPLVCTPKEEVITLGVSWIKKSNIHMHIISCIQNGIYVYWHFGWALYFTLSYFFQAFKHGINELLISSPLHVFISGPYGLHSTVNVREMFLAPLLSSQCLQSHCERTRSDILVCD